MVLSSRPFELTLKGGKGSSDEYIFFLGRLSGHGPEFQDRIGRGAVIHPENPDPPLVRKPHIKAEGDFGSHRSVGPRAVQF